MVPDGGTPTTQESNQTEGNETIPWPPTPPALPSPAVAFHGQTPSEARVQEKPFDAIHEGQLLRQEVRW